MAGSQALRLLRVLRSSSNHLSGISETFAAVGFPEMHTPPPMSIRGHSRYLFRGCRTCEAPADAFSDSNASGASTKPPKIPPPFTAESARAKVQFAEDAWNSKNPERVALAYTPDSNWRNRTEFFRGREAIKDFLRRKWAKELGYRLRKELWCHTDNRIAVRFEYEWHDDEGQWWRTHGNEMWEFDREGLMQRRDMSANDYKIKESERRIKVEQKPRDEEDRGV